MLRRCLLIAWTLAPAVRPETALPAVRQAHVLVLQKVYLNGEGPFRMMVDTGNASSVVRPAVARRLGLEPSGKIERATPSGSTLVPLAWLREVRVGDASDSPVEAMIAEPGLPGLDGVLGQSWLVRHDYLVDYRHRRVVLDGPPPPGARRPLRSPEGVPEIVVEVEGARRQLTVDSGAPALILFGRAPLVRRTAVWLEGPRISGGLLPVCAFDSVYVSNREGFVVLTGRGGVQ